MTDPHEIAAKLTKAQREAVLEGRVHDCPYNHPRGTRCPNCARWPFKKGGAAEFITAARAVLQEQSIGSAPSSVAKGE